MGNVITGGVVYRGGALGIGFFGRYFFADFGARRLWSVGLTIDPVTKEAQAGPILEHTTDLGGSAGLGNVSSFGLGADCEVYFLSWSAGELRRIVAAGGGTATGCPTPDPFLAAGGGIFSGGTWFPRTDPRVAGAGLGGSPGSSGTGSAGGCTTGQPAADWVCVDGGWVPASHPLAGSGTAPGGTGGGTGGSTGGSTGGATNSVCTTVQPVSGWLCVNGGWLPPDHPLAAAGSGQTGGSGAGGPPPGGTGGAGSSGCTTLRPASNWVCVNGGWVPPDHSLARGGGA